MENIFVGIASHDVMMVEWHSHPYWEIIYITSGSGILLANDKTINFKENMIICIPPNTSHKEYSQTGFRDIYYIYKDFINIWSGIPIFTDNTNMDFYKILMHMYLEFHKNQNNWSSIVYHLRETLYQYMVSLTSSSYKSPAVSLLENIILQNIPNAYFEIKKAMEGISKSPAYLRKLFKREIGNTPTEYLIEKRLDYAKVLISNTPVTLHSISSIALLSGFNDPYYFSRLFRKKTGKSPSEWRKDLLSNPGLQDKWSVS